MKPAAFDFIRPPTLPAALQALANPAATPIAGGQSLLPLLRLRLTAPEILVDIARLPELATTSRPLCIGATTTHAAIEDGQIPCPPFMRQVAAGIAYRAIRTLGTIGGSLAFADPAADWPTALLALNATVLLQGPSAERRVPLDAFLVSAFTTTLAPGEIITAIELPPTPARTAWAKLARKQGAWADSLAAIAWPENAPPRIVLGATTTRPALLLRTAEALEAAQDPTTALQADIAEADPDADPYRRRCHLATLRRALASLA